MNIIPKLPEEDLFKCFSYLNVEDLTTLELVSQTWKRVSSDNLLWRPFALEAGIKLTFEFPFSTKVKVIHSYTLYCRAAHLIFENVINTKLAHLVHEKIALDKMITSQSWDLDFARDFPYTYLTFLEKFFKNPLKINYKTPIAQVMLKAQFCTANDLLEDITPYLPLSESSAFLEYLSTRVEDPTATTVFPFCKTCFETNKEYPEYVHTLINKMSETEFLALLETPINKQSLLAIRTPIENHANRT